MLLPSQRLLAVLVDDREEVARGVSRNGRTWAAGVGGWSAQGVQPTVDLVEVEGGRGELAGLVEAQPV